MDVPEISMRDDGLVCEREREEEEETRYGEYKVAELAIKRERRRYLLERKV